MSGEPALEVLALEVLALEVMGELAQCDTAQGAAQVLERRLPVRVRLDGEAALTWTGLPPGDAVRGAFEAAALALLRHRQVAERCAALEHLALDLAGHSHEPGRGAQTPATLCRALDVAGAGVYSLRAGALEPEPGWSAGTVQAPKFTAAALHGLALGEVRIESSGTESDGTEPGTTEQATAPGGLLLPLGNRFPARTFLWVASPDRPWAPAELDTFRRLSGVLGAEHERVAGERQLASLLALQAQVLQAQPREAYAQLLRQAVRLIPGAECGSLLVLREGQFRYAAVERLDPAPLREVGFRPAQLREQWYGLGEAAWNSGQARVLRSNEVPVQARGYLRAEEFVPDVAPFVGDIRANLGVPILYGHEVYGFLNLDALADPDAFGPDSLEVAQAFAVQAALLIHHALQLERIQEAARTDALTGMPNRRAFTETLEHEVERARRYGLPLALVVMDLRRFKLVNDTYGHAEGDRALKFIADLLVASVRTGDLLFRMGPHRDAGLWSSSAQAFRWGGDEFAVLLPHTTLAGAQTFRERLRQAVRTQLPAAWPLDINVGVSELQPDDPQGERLLREADRDMYLDKAGTP